MRQALGKGLGALIPPAPEKPMEAGQQGGVQKILIEKIRPNRFQPRKHFDPEKLSELAQSIRQNGLAQPIIVCQDPNTNTFELIAGERRLRASQLAGFIEIEAVIKPPMDDRQRIAVALIENLQREDLNPIEEALGYLRLMKEFGMNQSELSDALGKSKSAISNTLRLLDLPEEIQKALHQGLITEGHARALLALREPIEMIKAFHLIVTDSLSVRDVEELTRRAAESPAVDGAEPRKEAPKKSADIRAIEEAIQRSIGTKAEIRLRKDGQKGSLTLHFYSLSDFDKIQKALIK